MASSAHANHVVDDESPFVRSSLREQIKDVILERIMGGTYPPGSRLVETRIAQELGVSQASVRESLRDLEHIGCVVYEPYRGCSVRRVSAEELLEAFPVRAALEALAAQLAAERMTDGELVGLRERFATMRRAGERGDAHDHSQADVEFHAAIMRASRNATLEKQWSLLEPYSRTYITASRPGADLVALAEQHRPVLAALEERDPDRAAQAMREHLMHAAELLERSLAGGVTA